MYILVCPCTDAFYIHILKNRHLPNFVHVRFVIFILIVIILEQIAQTSTLHLANQAL